jgi:hypothetical protein
LSKYSNATRTPDSGKLNKSEKCTFGVFSDKIIADFPLLDDKQYSWTWNNKYFYVSEKYFSVGFDYSWTVELGTEENRKFVAGEYTFGIGHSNNYYSSQHENSGTIVDLMRDMKALPGNIFIKEAEQGKIKEVGTFPIYIDHIDNDIILYSRSSMVMRILLSGHPTHAKMIMKTPYPLQSYMCMAKIYYSRPNISSNIFKTLLSTP